MGICLVGYQKVKYISSVRGDAALVDVHYGAGHIWVEEQPQPHALKGGWYETWGASEPVSMTCIYYNEFRDALASVSDLEAIDFSDGTMDDAPFGPLINFCDYAGAIRGDACVKLAKDFRKYEARLATGYLKRWYERLREALSIVTIDGCLELS